MADLNYGDKNSLEKLLGMSGGYVLTFTNRTLAEFVFDSVGLDILDDQYAAGSASKANRLRSFWSKEPNHVVGKLLADLIDQVDDSPHDPAFGDLKSKCSLVANRLLGGAVVEDLGALDVPSEERTFHLLAVAVRHAITQGSPEAALDRLHTYVVKYIRQICQPRGITIEETKPLHALVAEYTKAIKAVGKIESEITERILKNSIAIMEHFNFVRNRQSLAHDNDLIGGAESLLIVNHVVSTIRFIQTVERS